MPHKKTPPPSPALFHSFPRFVKVPRASRHLYTLPPFPFAYMEPETLIAMEHNMFTPGNYFYNGVGHVTVQYEKVLAIGYEGIRAEAEKRLSECDFGDGDYARKARFLQAVIISCDAVITYAPAPYKRSPVRWSSFPSNKCPLP